MIAIDTVEDRLEMAESFGATPVHLTEEDPRAEVKELTERRGVDLAVDAVGHPDALDLGLPAGPQGRHRVRDRRLRRAGRAAHGDRLDQGAHADTAGTPT